VPIDVIRDREASPLALSDGENCHGTERGATQLIKRILLNGTLVFLLLLCSRVPVAAQPNCLYAGKAYSQGDTLQMGRTPVTTSCYPNGWWGYGPNPPINQPATWTACVFKSQKYSLGAIVPMGPSSNISCEPNGWWDNPAGDAKWTACVDNTLNYSPGAMLMGPTRSCNKEGHWQ
jgi:hypothetical protein